jgi:hypothetical protein
MAKRDITGAVDFGYLDGFCAGDTALVDEVLGLFAEQAELWSRLLAPEGDAEAWRDGAHTLKGSALGIGAGEVARVCGEAEAAWREPPALKAAIKHRLDHAIMLARSDIAAWRHELALKGLR